MPRKSAASLTVVSSLDERRSRVSAPGHLPAEVRAVFDEITSSVSTRHLRECDSPVIAALAAAIHANREAMNAIAREGLLVDGHVNAHVAVLNTTSKLIASLSVKLRLTPTGRLDRKVAGQTTRADQLPVRTVVDGSNLLDQLAALQDDIK
jgi:phage terminase small subunit